MDTDTILKTLTPLPASDELIALIQKYAPNWIVNVLDGYAGDYTILQKNWENYCKMLQTTPKKILIVSSIETYHEEQKDFTFIQKVCDLLTLKGYCIRRIEEFTSCKGGCNKAISTKQLYHTLKNHPILSKHLKDSWSKKCSICS